MVLDNLETMRRLNHKLPWEQETTKSPSLNAQTSTNICRQESAPTEGANDPIIMENPDEACVSTSTNVNSENKDSLKSNPASANSSPTKKTGSPRRGSLKKWEGLERSYLDFVKSIEHSTMCR